MTALSVLRAALHDAVCVGIWAGYCEPGDSEHARRTQTATARAALRSQTPALVVHDAICPAQLDLTTFPDGCPERARHAAWIGERLP